MTANVKNLIKLQRFTKHVERKNGTPLPAKKKTNNNNNKIKREQKEHPAMSSSANDGAPAAQGLRENGNHVSGLHRKIGGVLRYEEIQRNSL